MALASRSVALAVLLAVAGPAAAGAAIIERRPVVDDGRITYQDEIESDDGFRLLETDGPDGRELVFQRTTGEEPLRSIDPDCVNEGDDLVRCRRLEGRDLVFANMVGGKDVLDGSAITSFRIVARTGFGEASLTGGALADDLFADEGPDEVYGLAGDDLLRSGSEDAFASDVDFVEGGPGRDKIFTLDDRDRVLARDGERDEVDCGDGGSDGSDVVVADRVDLLRNCEIVEYPPPPGGAGGPGPAATPAPGTEPRPEPEPEPQPQPQQDPQPAPQPAPGAQPEQDGPSQESRSRAESRRAAELRRVVRLSRRCAGRRGLRLRVRPAGGFVPRRTRVAVGGRVRARRTGSRVTVRLRRPARGRAVVRVVVTSRDGRRLEVRRILRRC